MDEPLQRNEIAEAEESAEVAVKSDRYNSCALVNLGCVFYAKGEYENAVREFQAALQCDGDRVEAVYNLGWVARKLYITYIFNGS